MSEVSHRGQAVFSYLIQKGQNSMGIEGETIEQSSCSHRPQLHSIHERQLEVLELGVMVEDVELKLVTGVEVVGVSKL